jgi:DNA-binding transcriptional regulator YdaS (Cro superfamily)
MDHPLTAFRVKQNPPMNKAALAKLLGVPRSSITRWEQGIRYPGKNVVPTIAERTGIAPADLRPDLAAMFKGAA